MKIKVLPQIGLIFIWSVVSLSAWPMKSTRFEEHSNQDGMRNHIGGEGSDQRNERTTDSTDPNSIELRKTIISGNGIGPIELQPDQDNEPHDDQVDLSNAELLQQLQEAEEAKNKWNIELPNTTFSIEEAQKAVYHWSERAERYEKRIKQLAINQETQENLGILSQLIIASNQAREAAQKRINGLLVEKLEKNLLPRTDWPTINHHAYEEMVAVKKFKEEHWPKLEESIFQYNQSLEQEEFIRHQIEESRHQHHENEERRRQGIHIIHITLGAVHVVFHYVIPHGLSEPTEEAIDFIKHRIHDAHATFPAIHALCETYITTPEDMLKWATEKSEKSKHIYEHACTDQTTISEQLKKSEKEVLDEFKRRVKISLEEYKIDPARCFSILFQEATQQKHNLVIFSGTVAGSMEALAENLGKRLRKIRDEHLFSIVPLLADDFRNQHSFKTAQAEKRTILNNLKNEKQVKEEILKSQNEQDEALGDESQVDRVISGAANRDELRDQLKQKEDEIKNLEEHLAHAKQNTKLKKIQALASSLRLKRKSEEGEWPIKIMSALVEAVQEVRHTQHTPLFSASELSENHQHNEVVTFVSNLKSHWAASNKAIEIFLKNKSSDNARRVHECFRTFKENFSSILPAGQLEQELRESCQIAKEVFDHASHILHRSCSSPFSNITEDILFGALFGHLAAPVSLPLAAAPGLLGPIGLGIQIVANGAGACYQLNANSIRTHAAAICKNANRIRRLQQRRAGSDFADGYQTISEIVFQVDSFIKALVEKLKDRSYLATDWK